MPTEDPDRTTPSESLDGELQSLAAAMQRLQSDPTIGGPALGVAAWDWRLWRIGRQVLSALGESAAPLPRGPRAEPIDIYLATTVYDVGGHTALIGDFVRALGADRAHLILTNVHGDLNGSLPAGVGARVALGASQVSVLEGPSLADRLHQLMAELRRRQPDRLFLFHHPQDPLASAVAQPELAGRCVLVHHADATASFGLFVPGVTIVDLNPRAVAPTRLLGLESWLLRLTAPDPGPRPAGFVAGGPLVTACCGSPHKFAGAYSYSYADTLALILRTTKGTHVHIGPLDAPALTAIEAALAMSGVSRDRFVHVVSTPSLPVALWKHRCDAFLASFPVDGARTKTEVLASGTPYVRHALVPPGPGQDRARDGEGMLVWRTWADLVSVLAELEDPCTRAAHGAHARAVYEGTYHPDVFARTLAAILAGSASPARPTTEQLVAGAERLIRALHAGAATPRQRP